MTNHPITPPEDLLQQMTNPDYRAMCAELADLLERSASVLSTYAFDKLASQGAAAAHRARALLAQPESIEDQIAKADAAHIRSKRVILTDP